MTLRGATSHRIASLPQRAVEIVDAANASICRYVAERAIGRAMHGVGAFRARARRSARGLLRVGAIRVGEAFDAKAARGVAIRLHRLAGRAFGTARHASEFADVAYLRRFAVRVGSAFSASGAFDIAIRVGFCAVQIDDAPHARAQRSAEFLGPFAVRVADALDASCRRDVALGRWGSALAVASASLARLFGSACGVRNEADGCRVTHRAVRGRREESQLDDVRQSAKRAPRRGVEGGCRAVHPYR